MQGKSDPTPSCWTRRRCAASWLLRTPLMRSWRITRYLFPDELFADLFPSDRGRPSVPADVVATVMVLQALEGLSDREADDAVADHIAWKVAAGLAIDDEGIDYSVLTYWRSRSGVADRRSGSSTRCAGRRRNGRGEGQDPPSIGLGVARRRGGHTRHGHAAGLRRSAGFGGSCLKQRGSRRRPRLRHRGQAGVRVGRSRRQDAL